MGKIKQKDAGSKAEELPQGSLADLLLGKGAAGINEKAASLFDASTAAKLQRTSKPEEVPPKPKRKREKEEEAPQTTKKGKVRPARPLKSEKEANKLVVATAPLAPQDKQPAGAATDAKSTSSTAKGKASMKKEEEGKKDGGKKDGGKKKDKKEKKKDKPAEQQEPVEEEEEQAPPPASSKAHKQQGRGKQQAKKEQPPPAVQEEEEEEEGDEEKEEAEEETDGSVEGDVGGGEDDDGPLRRRKDDPEKDDKTIFVGNLPVTTTKAQIISLFKAAGKIESVRLRSMALQGTKVDQHGNQTLVKKVSANKKLFATEVKDTCNAYVVFESEASVEAALKLNGTLYHDKHLRVDHVGRDASKDYQRSLFLGNLPFDVADEEVREHFAAILEEGHEAIESVRIVRDPESQVGKGFGFLLLKDKAALAEILRAGEQTLKGRQIRVTTCGRRMKKASGKYGPAHTPRASFEGRRTVDAFVKRRKSKDGKKGGGKGGKALPGVRLKKRSGPAGGPKKKGGPGGGGGKPMKKGPKKPGAGAGFKSPNKKPKGPKGGPSRGKGVKKGRK